MKLLSSQAPVFDAPQAAPRNRFSVSRTAGSMPVWRPAAPRADFAPQAATPAGIDPSQKLRFGDLIDVVNPLQHIPLVGMVYRQATGDAITPAAQFIGSVVFGGPIGGALAVADAAVRGRTGRGIGENVLAMIRGGEAVPPPARDSGNVAITIASRMKEEPRMAGTLPVWKGGLSADTHFAALLQDLAAEKPNIS